RPEPELLLLAHEAAEPMVSRRLLSAHEVVWRGLGRAQLFSAPHGALGVVAPNEHRVGPTPINPPHRRILANVIEIRGVLDVGTERVVCGADGASESVGRPLLQSSIKLARCFAEVLELAREVLELAREVLELVRLFPEVPPGGADGRRNTRLSPSAAVQLVEFPLDDAGDMRHQDP